MSTKRVLIDAAHPEETRVAIANGTRLEDFDVEAKARQPLKGNIYLAKVTRVEPSLQACFVEYGGNRHGFLAFNEIHPDYYQIPVADREALVAEQQAAEAAVGEADEEDASGAPVETVGGDDEDEVRQRRAVAHKRHYKIQEVIKRRQILLIQVVKEERGNKGAALTTYLSLAGRYCVLMPNTARGGGISRKISNVTDRRRLKKILAELEIPQGMAVIVRTAGSKRTKAEIKRDYEYLMRLFAQVRETTLGSIAPCLVHQEGDIVRRTIRDLYTREIEEIIVEGQDAYRDAKDFMKLLIPSHAKKVKRHEEDVPLFQKYQIEGQLDAMHSPDVHLKSGGYIVINPTEALVSIDVNSGRATKERNIEETALKTNIEAAEEIARQLRLRDLAGLIVIDFIDMEVSRNQGKVERAVKDAMRADRARIQIGRISPFGLLELSRQRLRPSVFETSFSPCPHCAGTGQRRSTDSSALQMLRVLEEEGTRHSPKALVLHVPTAIALYIFNNKRATLAEIEQRHGFTIQIEADDALVPPAYRLERIRTSGDGEDAEEVVETVTSSDNDEDGGGKRRRRRRSRRRKRDDASEQIDAQGDEDRSDEADAQDGTQDDDENGDGDAPQQDAQEDEGGGRRRRRRGRRGGRNRRRGSQSADHADDEGRTDGDIQNDDESDAAVADGAESGPPEADGTAAEDAEAAMDEKPARRPRRRRRSRAERNDDAPATDASDAEPQEDAANAVAGSSGDADGDVTEKPRRRRSRGRKKSDETADTSVDAAAEPATGEEARQEESAPEAPKADPDPAPALAKANGGAQTEEKSEDQEEAERAASKTTVVEVGDAPAESGERPTRKGWWQRLVE